MSHGKIRWFWPPDVAARREAREFANLRARVEADIRDQIRRTSPTPLYEDTRYALGDPGLPILTRPSLVAALHMAALADVLGDAL